MIAVLQRVPWRGSERRRTHPRKGLVPKKRRSGSGCEPGDALARAQNDFGQRGNTAFQIGLPRRTAHPVLRQHETKTTTSGRSGPILALPTSSYERPQSDHESPLDPLNGPTGPTFDWTSALNGACMVEINDPCRTATRPA